MASHKVGHSWAPSTQGFGLSQLVDDSNPLGSGGQQNRKSLGLRISQEMPGLAVLATSDLSGLRAMLHFSHPQTWGSSEKLFRMAVLHVNSSPTNFRGMENKHESLALASKCLSDTPHTHSHCCCSAAKLCPTPCDPTDYRTLGFPVLHHLPEFAQTHVRWVSDAIPPSHPLSHFTGQSKLHDHN